MSLAEALYLLIEFIRLLVDIRLVQITLRKNNRLRFDSLTVIF